MIQGCCNFLLRSCKKHLRIVARIPRERRAILFPVSCRLPPSICTILPGDQRLNRLAGYGVAERRPAVELRQFAKEGPRAECVKVLARAVGLVAVNVHLAAENDGEADANFANLRQCVPQREAADLPKRRARSISVVSRCGRIWSRRVSRIEGLLSPSSHLSNGGTSEKLFYCRLARRICHRLRVANRGYLLETRNLGLWHTGKLAHPSRLIVGVGVTNALLHGPHRVEPSYSLATKKDSTAPTTWAELKRPHCPINYAALSKPSAFIASWTFGRASTRAR